MTPAPVNSLRELPDDPRDFALGGVFTLPKVEELPEEFILPTILTIRNQEETGEYDFCTGYAGTSASSMQEGVSLSPRWLFARTKARMGGDVDEFGADLRSMMKTLQKEGSVEDAELTENERTMGQAQARRAENYRAELAESALRHKKASYFSAGRTYDEIRASLHKFKAPVCLGVKWGWALSDYELKGIPDNGFGHCVYAIGWRTGGLVIVNSYGMSAGQGGTHLLAPEAVNAFAPRYGAYLFTDMPAEEAKWKLDNGIREGDNWLTELFKSLLSLFRFR